MLEMLRRAGINYQAGVAQIESKSKGVTWDWGGGGGGGGGQMPFFATPPPPQMKPWQ